MAGKAEEEEDDDDEEEDVERGGGAGVAWRVTDGSSEAEVHPATNVLNADRFRLWQTQRPCDHAWLVLEPRPPSAFSRVEIVNAGSSLVDIHGLRADVGDAVSSDYELLLSSQQVMTVKDLMSKANRNRALTYDIDANHKLSPIAAQQRWQKLRINCRQPFGTSEHRAPIGLAHIKFTTCKPSGCSQLPQSETGVKRKGSSDSVSTEIHEGKLQKKPKQTEATKLDVNPEPQEYALPQIPRMDGSMSKMKIRSDGKGFVEERMPDIDKVTKPDNGKRDKYSKPKLVIGMEVATATDPTLDCQAFRLASSPFPRKDVSVSKMISRLDIQNGCDGNRKAKIRGVKEEVAVGLPATKWSDNVQTSPCTGKTENVDIGVNAAQEVGNSERGHANRYGVSPHTTLNSAQDSGKAGSKVRLEGTSSSSSMIPATVIEDFAKVLEGVVFAISGIQNPARGLFRTQGLEMGAQYCPDWTSDCTVLVCAFKDTPKFKQVRADGGTIVSKEWISECHKQRKLVSIERFLMHKGRPWRKQVYKLNCGSLEEVRQWVYDDLASTCKWLQQREQKPEPDELELTAAQGIMVCFEDTIKCIHNNQGVISVVDSWGCLPRGIKELAAMEQGSGGYVKGTRTNMLGEAARLKDVYTDILNPIFVACSKTSLPGTNGAIKKEKKKQKQKR